MKKVTFIVMLTVSTFLLKCSPTDPSIGPPPNIPAFTYAATANPNYIVFTATSTGSFLYNWDFGNGITSIKKVDTAYYPFPDTYAVSLTVSNKGGAAVIKDTVVVLTLDSAIAKNKNYKLLTGGIESEIGKTWVWFSEDSAMSKGEYKNGITDPLDLSWWQINAADLDPLALDDEYVFTLKNYKYENRCKGFFMYSWVWIKELKNIIMGKYKDSSLVYEPPSPSSWKLTEQVNVTTIDTVIIDTIVTIKSTVIIDTVIIDTIVIDTVIIDTTMISDTVIIDTIVINTIIIDTLMPDTTIVIDTVVIDTIIIDTFTINTVVIDTTLYDTTIVIDTTIIDTTVVIDTTIINSVTADTLLILDLSNTNYIGLCAGTSTYQIMSLKQDTMLIRYPLYEPDKGEYESWYYLRLITKE